MVNIEIGKIGVEILDLGIVKLGKINWEKLIGKNRLGKLYYNQNNHAYIFV